jgi:type IV secretory pathway VirB4 component
MKKAGILLPTTTYCHPVRTSLIISLIQIPEVIVIQRRQVILVSTMKHSSANTNHENANGADQMPNRADAPLFMMVHQENTPFRANPHGYRLFD